MPEQTSDIFSCPACGQGFRWRSALAGKTLACKACDKPFTIPDAPGKGLPAQPEPAQQTPTEKPKPQPPADHQESFEDDGTYELDLDGLDEHEGPASTPPAAAAASKAGGKPAPAHAGNCPSCNSPLQPHAVVCMNCGFDTTQGQAIETSVADKPPASAAPDTHALAEPAPEPPAAPGQAKSDLPPPTKMTKEAKREAARIAAAQQEHEESLRKRKRMLIIGGVLVVAIIVLIIVF